MLITSNDDILIYEYWPFGPFLDQNLHENHVCYIHLYLAKGLHIISVQEAISHEWMVAAIHISFKCFHTYKAYIPAEIYPDVECHSSSMG